MLTARYSTGARIINNVWQSVIVVRCECVEMWHSNLSTIYIQHLYTTNERSVAEAHRNRLARINFDASRPSFVKSCDYRVVPVKVYDELHC